MLLEHPDPGGDLPAAFSLACPRAGHGCARDGIPVSAAAGWDLVQRDWGLRQREPGPPGAIDRAGAQVLRIVRAFVRFVAAWVSRGRQAERPR
jgi:hypothetical protein